MFYFIIMETKQTEIAKFLGISDGLLSLVRNGKSEFGKPFAIKIAEKTGLPKEWLTFNRGENFYKTLEAVCVSLMKKEG